MYFRKSTRLGLRSSRPTSLATCSRSARPLLRRIHKQVKEDELSHHQSALVAWNKLSTNSLALPSALLEIDIFREQGVIRTDRVYKTAISVDPDLFVCDSIHNANKEWTPTCMCFYFGYDSNAQVH